VQISVSDRKKQLIRFMNKRRILLIAGILVAILIGLSTGLFGNEYTMIAKEATPQNITDH
jgi:hypothetical protein